MKQSDKIMPLLMFVMVGLYLNLQHADIKNQFVVRESTDEIRKLAT